MAIPPPLPAHKSSAHRLIARDCVFYHTSEEMTVMRQARCERRTVVKYKRLSVFCLFQSFFKNMIFLPEFQYLLFLLRCRPPFRLLAVIFFHNMNIISLYAPQKSWVYRIKIQHIKCPFQRFSTVSIKYSISQFVLCRGRIRYYIILYDPGVVDRLSIPSWLNGQKNGITQNKNARRLRRVSFIYCYVHSFNSNYSLALHCSHNNFSSFFFYLVVCFF